MTAPASLKKPSRAAKVDARVSSDLRRQLETIASVRDSELSDIVRDALRLYVAQFQRQMRAPMHFQPAS